MKVHLIILLSFFSLKTLAQKTEDSQIIITLPDNTDLYRKTKIAMVNADFIVKENYNIDTLTTYSREFTNIQGHCIAVAVIKKNTVTISGFFSLKRIDWFGYTKSSVNFQKVIYFKGSKGWNLLMQIAEGIGGEISFAK
ncbi:MAG: hypothetical protein SFU21_12060 [Flavihumibacter sp.]|nr:hypothetical protein [Flavihumibacter sp.]